MKLFVVDDSPRIRLVVTRQLSKLGFKDVEQAEDATSLLALLENSSPDIVFLDVQMPGADRENLLIKILDRNIEANVIVMTALDRQDERVKEFLSLGAWAHLQKPFYPDDISDLMEKSKAEERSLPLFKMGQTHLFTN